jgi:tetratricopeptide (TPR) repeat protein
MRRLFGAALLALAPAMTGCGGHAARTLEMRTALDAGDARRAIAAVNKELEVDSEKELPKEILGDNALLVLDRASIQQGQAKFDLARRDFEAADKAIDMLDLARNAGDSIGEYVFSGSSGKYVAPPYEKLLVNTLNMLNYLELGDLNGARVEARRLSVVQKYYRDQLGQRDNPVVGLGSMLAGFAYEKSGEIDEALRYYDESLQFASFGSLRDPVRRIASLGSYRSPRLKALLDENTKPPAEDGMGEILFVVGFGRVPHKIPQRIPIGLALTYVSGAISPHDRERANKLAVQGLVTWVNFPSLAPGTGTYATPSLRMGSQFLQLEEAVDVDHEVREEWKKIEGKIILSAITRLIARVAVGQGIQAASGKDSVVGFLGSIAAQATLTALDTPDTRSWETLPARVAVVRVRVPAGTYPIEIDARGWKRTQQLVVKEGGWAVASLMALR